MFIRSAGHSGITRNARRWLSKVPLFVSSAVHERVRNITAALAANGFAAGDRLALLLPNSPEYIEFGLRLQLARRYCSPDKCTALRSRNRSCSA